jgi:hypothetical protein
MSEDDISFTLFIILKKHHIIFFSYLLLLFYPLRIVVRLSYSIECGFEFSVHTSMYIRKSFYIRLLKNEKISSKNVDQIVPVEKSMNATDVRLFAEDNVQNFHSRNILANVYIYLYVYTCICTIIYYRKHMIYFKSRKFVAVKH